MANIYNFSAGPATLPKEVLKKAADEMLDYKGCGMSVMELSHRVKEFTQIIEAAEADLREIMNIPENYKVLFLQGGASLQFAMVPMNLMVKNKKADYVHTGQWSKKAIAEAKKFGTVNVVATSEKENFTHIPKLDPATFSKDADYFYIVTNNTIYGTEYKQIPDTGDVPLVADMSSDILSVPIDVTKFGLIFAGAQKNIGPAGMAIVIIREDLVGLAADSIPSLMNYKIIFTKSYTKIAITFFKSQPDLIGQYEKTLKLLELNPFHPSLRLHSLKGKENEHTVSMVCGNNFAAYRDNSACAETGLKRLYHIDLIQAGV